MRVTHEGERAAAGGAVFTESCYAPARRRHVLPRSVRASKKQLYVAPLFITFSDHVAVRVWRSVRPKLDQMRTGFFRTKHFSTQLSPAVYDNTIAITRGDVCINIDSCCLLCKVSGDQATPKTPNDEQLKKQYKLIFLFFPFLVFYTHCNTIDTTVCIQCCTLLTFPPFKVGGRNIS